MDDLKKTLKPYLTQNNILVAIVVFGVLLVAIVLIAQSIISRSPIDITEDQIKIQQGDKTLIVNRNGLIEYKSEGEVFYRIWDSSRISDFFKYIENKAQGPTGGENCYQVSLFINGKYTSVCIDDDQGFIEDAFEEFNDESGGGDVKISDFFDDGDDEDDEGDDNVVTTSTPTPSPGPTGSSTSPTPTPYGGSGGGGSNDPPVVADCDAWEQYIVGGRAIISNTLCTVNPEE
jgi:hypothetical protein